ncbi:MAG: GyrI-like domain-containing protein [Lutibacter sp.]|uniref:SRPBCC family protein n=1 Tax=Lutibacter sp. TaxID=1925666 RepID=UPI00385CA9C4
MKLLKYIFFLFLILIIGVSIYIATLDGNYNINKSRMIKAPVEVVFNEVNDFKNWENWGPWYELDSTITASFPDNTSGIGASYTWTGADGNGSMETLSIIPNKEIIQQIDFGTGTKPEVYWQFNVVNKNTEVTWGMKGKSGFMEKAYWLTQGGIKKNMTPMYERGLELLNNYITKEMEKHTIEIKGIVDYGGGYYLYQTTACKFSEIDKKTEEMFPLIMNYMKENNIQPAGKPFTITHKWDEENGTIMFSTCIPVSERIVTTGDVLTGFIKPQKMFKTLFTGNYKYLPDAWKTAFKNLYTENLKELPNAEPLEVYLVNQEDTPNPAKWVTEIYIPIE